MPIPVTCSGCSASFNVKDVYAGKRAKCPKCGGPIVVPSPFHGGDTFQMPPPAKAAKPVVASTPKPAPVPADDEADEPTPKRRRDADDEQPKTKRRGEVEEKPTAKRRRDDDGDEDKPTTKKRRRDDDDEPKKKKNALPLILGIFVGLVLVCGGGGAALWFFVIEPAMNPAVVKYTGPIATGAPGIGRPPIQPPQPGPQQSPVLEGAVTKENQAKLKAGMKLTEVQALLGTGRPPSSALEFGGSAHSSNVERNALWDAKNQLGHVLIWRVSPNAITVAFADAPSKGETTVVGVVGSFGFDTTETVKLPGGKDPSAPNPNATPVDPKTLPYFPEATLTATELAKDHAKYKGKWVIVTGKVKHGMLEKPGEEGEPSWKHVTLEQQGLPIKFFATNGLDPDKSLLAGGESVEIWGNVVGLSNDEDAVQLGGCMLSKPAVDVEVTKLLEEFKKDKAGAEKTYAGKALKLTGMVRKHAGQLEFVPSGVSGDRDEVYSPALDDDEFKAKAGDRVTILTDGVIFTVEEGRPEAKIRIPRGRVVAVFR